MLRQCEEHWGREGRGGPLCRGRSIGFAFPQMIQVEAYWILFEMLCQQGQELRDQYATDYNEKK